MIGYRQLVALPLLAAVIGAGGREVIHVGGGARIEGDVVKETADTVFVDVGWTVLGVPAKEIVRREAADEGASAAGSGGAAASRGPADGLYIEGGGLREGTVKELADTLGSSVVLVSCPGKSGSGFFISAEGHVITNCHVIERERKITLTVFEKRGREFVRKKVEDVSIVALNPYFDLALLKVEDPSAIRFTPAPLGSAMNLAAGQKVFAIGNPLGLERTVTEGIVSMLAREFEGLTYIQTSTQINPGNSGGPLFNLRGEVVGVTNMGILAAEGLAFAIPVDRVKELLQNREAFAFDADHPNSGHRYLAPPQPGAADGPRSDK
jgi:serine protease Do